MLGRYGDRVYCNMVFPMFSGKALAALYDLYTKGTKITHVFLISLIPNIPNFSQRKIME